MSEIESLLDTKAVGRVIGVSEITLRKWRMGVSGPPLSSSDRMSDTA